ncbi:reticulon-2 isoform X3 [Phaenicophaeus curvirostris]|uniref:reticulon-2 isoform X3 n=1 Tax=Phaenicophaeus curvirostris TaxID=33595 RepID=UPI0037F0D72F
MEGQVWALLSWRAPGPSALALVASLATLGSLARFGVVTVGSHAALAVLAVTVPRRLYRAGVRSLRRLPATPARTQPEGPVGLSPEQQQLWARRLARHLSAAKHTLTRLFLVHSLPESLKFAFFFYLLTYVGAVCNGVTLLGAGADRAEPGPAEEPPGPPPSQDPSRAPQFQTGKALTLPVSPPPTLR